MINATLAQFEVPTEMSQATVLKEVLKELDMDIEDVADGAQAMLRKGIETHLEHRLTSSASKLHSTLNELRDMITPALPSPGGGGGGGSGSMLPRLVRVGVERLVGKVLNQLPGVLGSNDDALHVLLTSLNLTDPNNETALAEASKKKKGMVVMEEVTPGLLRLLRSATDTHCDGLRRQEAREVAIRQLQKLLMADVSVDDPVPPPLDDEDDDEDEEEEGVEEGGWWWWWWW